MKKSTAILSLLLLCASATAWAQGAAPKRPPITGVAHAAYFTKDFEGSRRFFKEFLGYNEPITLTNADGVATLAVIKINDRQFVEIFPEREANTHRMYHFAIETPDAEAMRVYLESKGYKVPEKTPKGRTGNSNYFVTDPNGTICEIVQYEPDGMTALNRGKDLPDTRVSNRMSHVGFMVPDLDKATSFYCDVLGFTEVWRGGSSPDRVTWVHLKVPEGDETIELMLYNSDPTWDRMGTMNHICLEVKDVNVAKQTLDARRLPEGYREPNGPNTGINKKRQINYYMIDGTRIEVMEDHTIDGLPAPSSTAPPLKYVPAN